MDGDGYADGAVFPDECGDCAGSCEDMGGGYIACNDTGGGLADCAGNCDGLAQGYQIGDDFSNLVANPDAFYWDPSILATGNNGIHQVAPFNLSFFNNYQTVYGDANYYNDHFNGNPAFLIYIQQYLESIHHIDNYTETYFPSEPYHSYANWMLYTNGNVENRFQCCPEGTDVVTCCLDLDNTNFCDDIEYTTLLTGGQPSVSPDPFVSALTLTNSNGLLDFCGNCPEVAGWIEVSEPDVYGCMDPEALNFSSLANVPCGVNSSVPALNDDGTINFDTTPPGGECCEYLAGGLRVGTAPAFGISDSSRNIYPIGSDNRTSFIANNGDVYSNMNYNGWMHPSFVGPYTDAGGEPLWIEGPDGLVQIYDYGGDVGDYSEDDIHPYVRCISYEITIEEQISGTVYNKTFSNDTVEFANFVKGNFIYNFSSSGDYRFTTSISIWSYE